MPRSRRVGGDVGDHESRERPRDAVAGRRCRAVDEHAPVAVDGQRTAVDDRAFAPRIEFIEFGL